MTQVKKHRFQGAIVGAFMALGLTACASVKIPKLDLMKLPDFRAESEKLGQYPAVEDAPGLPDEVRSDRDWDRVASDIIKIRDNFDSPVEPDRPKNEAEIDREINRLTDAVNEYRADDPPGN